MTSIKILDIIYPPVCGICGRLNDNFICKKCKIKLKNNEIYGIDNYEEDSEKYFKEHIYMFRYDGQIRNAILDYKFWEKTYIYETFMNFLKNNQKICVQIEKYDIIMPVPISRKRKLQRGYNQSSIIAKQISKFLNIEYTENILIKKIDNQAQSTLNSTERKQNVIGVYSIDKKMLQKKILKNETMHKKILLVDDIFTTGSTVNECSKLLVQAGASEVGVFTIAKD